MLQRLDLLGRRAAVAPAGLTTLLALAIAAALLAAPGDEPQPGESVASRIGKKRGSKWHFNQSSLFLDFLAGNQPYKCTPWGNPTRNYFGWQRPCYLLGEGYTRTFKELMEETDWDSYGTGNYEKCAQCMVHSGYEATAVVDSVHNPLKAAMISLRGVRTTGAMAPEIPLDRQRPAEYVFSRHVEEAMARLNRGSDRSKREPKRAGGAG